MLLPKSMDLIWIGVFVDNKILLLLQDSVSRNGSCHLRGWGKIVTYVIVYILLHYHTLSGGERNKMK